MMTDKSMVERVARAMFDVTPFREEGPYEAQTETYRKMCRLLARAAIAEMREPTDAMCDAVPKIVVLEDIWKTMIDAALKDEGVEG